MRGPERGASRTDGHPRKKCADARPETPRRRGSALIIDHKSAKGRPAHVDLRAQDNVLQGSGDAGTEQGGRNYDQGPLTDPKYKAGDYLKTFDYIAANIPFSDKR